MHPVSGNLLKGKFGLISTTLMVAFAGLLLWSADAVFVHDQVACYAENGLVESVQAILLIAAGLVFLAPAVLERRSDKLILLFCALLCYSFVLREVDAEKLDVPKFLILIWSGVGRNVTLAVGFTVIIVCAAARFNVYKKLAVGFLKATPGILLLAGGACLLLGEIFEKNVALTHHAYLEEIVELLGYVLILLSAFAVNALTVAPGQRSSGPADY